MLLDERSRKIIEIDRVLAELHPVTPFGQKFRQEMTPFEIGKENELSEEFDRIEKMMGLILSQKSVFIELKAAMKQMKDLRLTIERSIKDETLTSVEFFELKNFAAVIKTISSCTAQMMWNVPEELKPCRIEWLEVLLDPEKSGIKTFYIYDCYSEKLGEIRKEKNKLEFELEGMKKAVYKAFEEETGMAFRSNGEVTIAKSNEKLIESLKEKTMLTIINETYLNTTFGLRDDELTNKYNKEIDFLRGEEAAEEIEILKILSKKVGAGGAEILANMDRIGRLDLLIAKAQYAQVINAVKPTFSKNGELDIHKGRHVLVETSIRKKGKEYTPIDVCLNKEVALITGANMGGKSVSLKMIGLLQAMFQYGMFVPAERFSSVLFEFIHVSAGDEQSIDKGLSTFGAEIKNINEALKKSKKSGLILIDELARGTNPHEGHAISAAIIDFLKKKPTKTVITTHFDGLALEDITHLQVKGLKEIDFCMLDESCHISDYMDYSLISIVGEIGIPRDAINISRIMGMPKEIIKKAEEIISES